MSEWRECKIGGVLDSANTGLDAIKRAPIVEYNTGIKCLRIQDISQSKSFENWGFSQVEERNYYKFALKKGDIIIARTGATIGVNLLIENDLKSVFNNGLIRLRVNKKIANYKYVYFTLCSSNYKGHIESISGGTSTQPNMQIKALLDYEINLPLLPEQAAIASILSSLDDKINLLNRQNITLEALTKTYFRQWFFEEADGETSFISNYAKLENMSANPKVMPDEMFYHYSIPAYDNGKKPIHEFGKEILSNKFRVPSKVILVSKLNPITPRVWAVLENNGENCVCSTEFQVLKPLCEKYFCYLYFLLKSQAVVAELAMSGSGTSGSHQRIRPEYILNVEMAKPSENRIKEFNNAFGDYINKIDNNLKQIQTLQRLRDTLLPKLISGEVKVKM